MKKILKKTAAILAALLMLAQVIPAMAATTTTSQPIQGTPEGYRDEMEIVASKGAIVLVGQTLQLDVNEGYSPAWSSSDDKIASIDANGLVTAAAPGVVTITAKEDEQHKAEVKITVIDPEQLIEDAQKEDKKGEPEDNVGKKTDKQTYIVIVINAESARYQYDGQAHTLDQYVATGNQDFDKSKIRVSGEIGVTATECGSYPFTLDASRFSYDDDSVIATFAVNNGWLKIRPAKATVKANKAEKQAGEKDPELTATVEGVYGNDKIAYTLTREAGEDPGMYIIEASGEEKQGNYTVSFEDAVFTISEAAAKAMPTQPLYNIAKIGSTDYRLAKTTIRTEKDPSRDAGKVISPEDYIVDDYDFTGLDIEISGKKYVYKCAENAEAIVQGANYYEVSGGTISIVKGKIGAMTNNKPNWLVPEADRYPDKNDTDSIHRDFEIKLYNGKKPAVAQTVYNMLSVNGSTDYYKMRTSTIQAQPLDEMKTGVVKAGEYILEKYDFTNVTVTIDGVEYKYSDGSLDEYENYFTVEFYNVEKSERFNKNNTWFGKHESWLDGSFEEYGDLPNATVSYHANYKATTHKGTPRPRKVTIESDWQEGKIGYPGAKVTLTATLEGFSENVRLQWEYSTDASNWTQQPGANGITYTYTLDETTAAYYWRVVAEDEN